ncbi:P-loop ATPase [Rhodobacterales bacterium HTCC2150]|nr:P-loop ATPase [Rhodobacterales bacterium HTCC2150] [Rhodobacteraceae bacterium HTCC2150]
MSINAMTVTAGDALLVLKNGWDVQKSHGIKMSYMMHGRPGIGKTQVAESLARHVEGRLYDIRLTQIDTSDLRGLPYYNHETKTTQWYRPEDLPESQEPAVLFLDEITSASPFLQPTVYGLLQERRVGMHKIPKNVIILAAGNTVDDGAVAYEMGTAIADRLVHMYVAADADDWINGYAIPNKLHATVIAFIKTRPDLLETTQESMKKGDMISATPRSWERVSQIMHTVKDRRVRSIMIAGTIGEAIMADFMLVADDIAATVQVTEMVKKSRKDRIAMYPSSLHGLNAMVFGLLALAKEENANEIIEIMMDLGRLSDLRKDDVGELRKLPLAELSTHGFECLLGKLMELGLHKLVLNNPDYQDYTESRKSLGLA